MEHIFFLLGVACILLAICLVVMAGRRKVSLINDALTMENNALKRQVTSLKREHDIVNDQLAIANAKLNRALDIIKSVGAKFEEDTA